MQESIREAAKNDCSIKIFCKKKKYLVKYLTITKNVSVY